MIYTIIFNKTQNKMTVFEINNDIKKELNDILNSNIKYFTKSFEINIDIDEMNMIMKGNVKNIDYNWERKYKKLTSGVIFSFIHDIADDINGATWDEVFITYDKKDPKNDIFSYNPVKIEEE